MNNQEIIDSLTKANQHVTSAQRELLQLTLKLQREAQGIKEAPYLATPTEAAEAIQTASAAVQKVIQDAAESVAAAPAAAHPEIFIPQMQVVDPEQMRAARHLSVVEPVAPNREGDSKLSASEALATAKSVLKDVLKGTGQEHLISLVDNVKESDLIRVRNASGASQPTAATAAAAMSDGNRLEHTTSADGPTLADTETHEQRMERESMATFIGNDSIFVRYLNSATIDGGQGSVGKYFSNLKRWQEDAFWVDEKRLITWPSGFYQNRDTKAQQLLINTDRAAVLVDGLPSAMSKVYVLRYGAEVGFEPVQMLEKLDRKRVTAYLDAAFKRLMEESRSSRTVGGSKT
jgi:hypothetical protein